MGVSTLLARINAELGGEPRTWSDLTIVRNVGPLVSSTPLDGDIISNRGFNALLAVPRDGPKHFLKVRPARHEPFRREAEATTRLSQHPATNALVPHARTFIAGSARVLAEAFVNGTALDVVIRARRQKAWHMLAVEALRLAPPLWDAIAEVAAPVADTFVGQDGVLSDLALLELLGLDATASSQLARHFCAVQLPAWPQHGDFWPRNVLVVAGGWKVLDFEACGEIVLPLYDVFHMIRGCSEAASGGAGNWLELWAEAGMAARPLSASVRRLSRGLETTAMEAALVAYLVEFAARLHRRGISRERTAGRLQELRALPGLLERGVVRQILAL